ncbi:MAG: hypothetical protein H6810_10095 [Phycisphaeraceae bacterium]|nr:MAG: hypothetical protein H6810_10095 [Phycisphaeraceae bacterium]
MLKFLRKYQMILLAVGGSLLMVVFLLQPVLKRMTPDPGKRTFATIGADKQKITLGEQGQANAELDVLEKFIPELRILLGIDREHQSAHWLMLKYEADRMGVIGVQQDGDDWIPELAYGLVLAQVQLARQQGQQVSNDDVNQSIATTTEALKARRRSMLQSYRMLDEGAFNQVLSKARGVTRLRQLYDGAVRMSEPQAVRLVEDRGTRILTDQLVLGPELIDTSDTPPTDEELAAQFEKYKNDRAGDTTANEYGFGYLQPARVKVEWLALDPKRISESVNPDPVLVRRRWQENHKEGESFDDARADLQNQIRDETVKQIMTEADELIRGDILAAERGLEKEGIYRKLPEGWTPPNYEKIAQDVVDAIRERHGIRITLPAVIRRTDRWLTPTDLRQLPGLGGANFRVGNRRVLTAMLPQMVRGVGTDTTVPVQLGLPVIEPVAEDADGAKYYITVLDARGESPPDDVEEIRSQVERDLNSLTAYKRLTEHLDEYRAMAVEGGLAAVTDVFRKDENDSRAKVRENIFVSYDRLVPATFQSLPDSRANVQPFRDAVVKIGDTLDPQAKPDTLPAEQAMVTLPLPASRAVVLARVRAKVPPTVEEYQLYEESMVAQQSREMVRDAQDGDDPLSYQSMVARLQYAEVKKKGSDDSDSDSDS